MAATPRSRFGDRIREARARRGWTQPELARRAGLAQSVVSTIESGGGASVRSLEMVCAGLNGELVLDARLPFAGEPSRQVDLGHARCVSSLRRLLESAGYVCATEAEVVDGPWRGWIDLVAHDASRRRIVIVEVKTELRDTGALDRQIGRYVRLILGFARSRGWVVAEIVVLAAVLATSDNDAFLVANREAMRASFPIRGRDAVACLLGPEPVRGRMLLMLDPRRRGRRCLTRAMVDGRRTAAPYRDYRAFVATLR